MARSASRPPQTSRWPSQVDKSALRNGRLSWRQRLTCATALHSGWRAAIRLVRGYKSYIRSLQKDVDVFSSAWMFVSNVSTAVLSISWTVYCVGSNEALGQPGAPAGLDPACNLVGLSNTASPFSTPEPVTMFAISRCPKGIICAN